MNRTAVFQEIIRLEAECNKYLPTLLSTEPRAYLIDKLINQLSLYENYKSGFSVLADDVKRHDFDWQFIIDVFTTTSQLVDKISDYQAIIVCIILDLIVEKVDDFRDVIEFIQSIENSPTEAATFFQKRVLQGKSPWPDALMPTRILTIVMYEAMALLLGRFYDEFGARETISRELLTCYRARAMTKSYLQDPLDGYEYCAARMERAADSDTFHRRYAVTQRFLGDTIVFKPQSSNYDTLSDIKRRFGLNYEKIDFFVNKASYCRHLFERTHVAYETKKDIKNTLLYEGHDSLRQIVNQMQVPEELLRLLLIASKSILVVDKFTRVTATNSWGIAVDMIKSRAEMLLRPPSKRITSEEYDHFYQIFATSKTSLTMIDPNSLKDFVARFGAPQKKLDRIKPCA